MNVNLRPKIDISIKLFKFYYKFNKSNNTK